MSRKYLLLLTVSLSVILLDQWTKYLVVRELTTRLDGQAELSDRLAAMYSVSAIEGPDRLHFHYKRHIDVLPSFFRLRYAENQGAAWGLFKSLSPEVRGPLFHVVTVCAVVLIVWAFSRLSGVREERWIRWGLPLVLGGAVGNYIDRLARGFVIDFLEAHWHDKIAWPSFNVADSAIVVGVGLLLVDAAVRKEKPALEEKPAPRA